ncbi:hypothetical protein L7F22_009907 [Adiantum nelumboides]|nr:hypothetical protein [Adiantum nelumboides]
MVLSCLANTFRRFLTHLKHCSRSSCSEEDEDMEQQGNQRSMQATLRNSSAVVEEKDSVTERLVLESVSTTSQSRHSMMRVVPVKRKLEELDLGVDNLSASQGRMRRENRDDYIDAHDSFICDKAHSLGETIELHMDENGVTLSEVNDNQDLSLGRENLKSPNLDINAALASRVEEFNSNKLSKESLSHLEQMELPTEDLWAIDTLDSMSSESGKLKSESTAIKVAQFCEPEAAQKARSENTLDAGCQLTAPSIAETGLTSGEGNVTSLDNGCHFHMLLQFFVKTYMDGRTIVLYGNASDTIESVHRQIFLKTGLPLSEQRLIYFGRQLQQDQTLADCHITNDATLHLVARMRSTALPHSWQLINDLVATVRGICSVDNEDGQARYNLIQAQLSIRASVKDFLKMATKSASFSEHMQIFQLAGATSALVMLLLSPSESNRETAEESIKLFFCTNEDYLPAQLHSYCVPVLLDFCKLLAKSAPAHSLYPVCRNALACLLDMTGPVHGNSFFQEVKADATVHDFAPFVNELSVSLCSNLRLTAMQYTSKGRSSHMSTYVKDGQDFTAFVILLCKAFEALKESGASCLNFGESENEVAVRGPSYGRLVRKPKEADRTSGDDSAKGSAGFSVGSKKWLRWIFQELLQAIDSCLAVIQPTQTSGSLDEKTFWWAPFLIILKGLNSIARVYGDASTELLATVQTRQSMINMLIKHSRWQDDHSWLLDYKQVLNFESKRKLAMAMLPEPQDDHEERQEVSVTRSSLLSESFEMLAYADPDTLQGGLSLEFVSEEATGPGVLREWFFLICREIFNPQNALFKSCVSDGRRVFPNAGMCPIQMHLL